MMTNYFLKLLCRSSSRLTEQQNFQQYNFNKIIQQQQQQKTKQKQTCVIPKLKSHWNKNKKCSYCPSFFVFFHFFFFFRPHFLVLFSLFFLNFFNSHSFGMYIFSVFNLFSYFHIFDFLIFLNLGSIAHYVFCLHSTSVLITANFISPSQVISVIN